MLRRLDPLFLVVRAFGSALFVLVEFGRVAERSEQPSVAR